MPDEFYRRPAPKTPKKRHRPGRERYHRNITFSFSCPPEDRPMVEAFEREVLRLDHDGKPFAVDRGKGIMRLIAEWMADRGAEIKKGVRSALQPNLPAFA